MGRRSKKKRHGSNQSKFNKNDGRESRRFERSDHPLDRHANRNRHHRNRLEQYDDDTRPPSLIERKDLKASFKTARRNTAQFIEEQVTHHAEAKTEKPTLTSSSGIQLDPWQKRALDYLLAGRSVIVDAPTTAGKTRIVEAFFSEKLRDPSFRAAYTTPVKSLSHDKLREFRVMFGEHNIGIATGDVKENLTAPIVVATLETYRNSLLGTEPDLGRSLVVFDEYHYLQDEGRGSAWEEAMILTPSTCQLLLLSASVANSNEFKAWMTVLRGDDCELVVSTKRPVPLTDLVYYGNEWFLASELPPEVFEITDKKLMHFPLRIEELTSRLPCLEDLQLTPCIIYAGRRLATENLAYFLAKKLDPIHPEATKAIRAIIDQYDSDIRVRSFLSPNLLKMIEQYGVSFHHSGLGLPARILIEHLVKDGQLRFCAATMGLSLGINFSVRSALISDYTRPGEAGFTDYSPSEVLQMLGRAGRRGRDPVGFSLWPTPESMNRLGGASRESCHSKLRNDPTTFLCLVGRGFTLPAIENFYKKSFLSFKNRRTGLHLIHRERIEEKLNSGHLPCFSPAAELVRFWLGKDRRGKDPQNESTSSLCFKCPHRKHCHVIQETFLNAQNDGSLTELHFHLHAIGALDRDELLSLFGSIARYFPQAGGLLISHKLATGEISSKNLSTAGELFGALCLARHKEPGLDPDYKFPFDARKILEGIEDFYPTEIFPEMYDYGNARNREPVIRDFNPAGGFIVREWLQGASWDELSKVVTREVFGPGDMMAVLYRTATYFQSLCSTIIALYAKDDEAKLLFESSKYIRERLLRAPLSYSLEK